MSKKQFRGKYSSTRQFSTQIALLAIWLLSLRIRWTTRQMKESVLNRSLQRGELFEAIEELHLHFLGHVSRKGQLESW